MDSASEQQLASAGFGLVVDGYRLRPWAASDAGVMVDIVSEPTIPRWTFLPYDMAAEQAERWIENREAQRRSGSGFALAIETHHTGQVLGCVGLAGLDAELGPEAYFWIGASARRQGVATRALSRVCRWAFDTAGVARVRLFTEPDNWPSCRVAERVGGRGRSFPASCPSPTPTRRCGSVPSGLLAVNHCPSGPARAGPSGTAGLDR